MPATLTIPSTDTSRRQPGQPWDLDEFAQFIGICRKTGERAIKDGKLKAIRIGRRVLIPDAEVRRVAEAGI